MLWANFFHIYQPPEWPAKIIKKVASESYRPVLAILKRNPNIKITLNISGSLTEQLAAHKLTDIIDGIKLLAKRGQIEFTGTAIYHPILPLLPSKEIVRQINLNTVKNKKYFGPIYRPQGFFPPEMAYGRKVVTAIELLGFRWIIADEISYDGSLNSCNFDALYRIQDTKIFIVFRNRKISDYFAFHGNPSKPEEFWSAAEKDGRSSTALITAMDGENLGHHRQGWDEYWQQLVTSESVTTTTISELLHKYSKEKIISPRRASWSSQQREIKRGSPYVLWDDPHNTIHQLQWRLLRHVTDLVEGSKRASTYKTARALLDKRLASDQFWWASAKPWWSLEILTKKTDELLAIVTLINQQDSLSKKLVREIIGTAKMWQDENIFKTKADEYLASEEDAGVRFIGGNKLM